MNKPATPFEILALQMTEIIEKLKTTKDRKKRRELLAVMHLIMDEMDQLTGLKGSD
jgi:hypothetical protein